MSETKQRKTDLARAAKLLDKIEKSNDLAFRAYDRWSRVSGGTTTSHREWDNYCRHFEAYEVAVKDLRTVLAETMRAE